MAKSKKPFEIVIEAKIVVQAFDEDSAKKKAEKVLGKPVPVGPDVSFTGDVWTYDAIRLNA